ncbi:hypothetical protein CC85DRAFT_328860 [Cutaneotrichosporon oleaginosum]|uniref:Uncharacterized protein n=1 Tax=Cutaneotrichosporon oleaginosum TaxID=879819 RepID=A0A0J0XKW6_9TREE|nr:uncharacterized protein CC85DRAFT_328860 [Cutaneotrichosporon oleaginosum]KLT41720.1 hypothetical protein CC85DRAFT_328860 [Cutaneotrichosporon oleaginosum]TXT08092.1 hypothetical protein COLE_05016 [Cutaneotrichosporon oleaginosum]
MTPHSQLLTMATSSDGHSPPGPSSPTSASLSLPSTPTRPPTPPSPTGSVRSTRSISSARLARLRSVEDEIVTGRRAIRPTSTITPTTLYAFLGVRPEIEHAELRRLYAVHVDQRRTSNSPLTGSVTQRAALITSVERSELRDAIFNLLLDRETRRAYDAGLHREGDVREGSPMSSLYSVRRESVSREETSSPSSIRSPPEASSPNATIRANTAPPLHTSTRFAELSDLPDLPGWCPLTHQRGVAQLVDRGLQVQERRMWRRGPRTPVVEVFQLPPLAPLSPIEPLVPILALAPTQAATVRSNFFAAPSSGPPASPNAPAPPAPLGYPVPPTFPAAPASPVSPVSPTSPTYLLPAPPNSPVSPTPHAPLPTTSVSTLLPATPRRPPRPTRPLPPIPRPSPPSPPPPTPSPAPPPSSPSQPTQVSIHSFPIDPSPPRPVTRHPDLSSPVSLRGPGHRKPSPSLTPSLLAAIQEEEQRRSSSSARDQLKQLHKQQTDQLKQQQQQRGRPASDPHSDEVATGCLGLGRRLKNLTRRIKAKPQVTIAVANASNDPNPPPSPPPESFNVNAYPGSMVPGYILVNDDQKPTPHKAHVRFISDPDVRYITNQHVDSSDTPESDTGPVDDTVVTPPNQPTESAGTEAAAASVPAPPAQGLPKPVRGILKPLRDTSPVDAPESIRNAILEVSHKFTQPPTALVTMPAPTIPHKLEPLQPAAAPDSKPAHTSIPNVHLKPLPPLPHTAAHAAPAETPTRRIQRKPVPSLTVAAEPAPEANLARDPSDLPAPPTTGDSAPVDGGQSTLRASPDPPPSPTLPLAPPADAAETPAGRVYRILGQLYDAVAAMARDTDAPDLDNGYPPRGPSPLRRVPRVTPRGHSRSAHGAVYRPLNVHVPTPPGEWLWAPSPPQSAWERVQWWWRRSVDMARRRVAEWMRRVGEWSRSRPGWYWRARFAMVSRG